MARARNLKPSFFTNDKLAELEPLARLLFQGLWCITDRAGRLEDRPKRIKAELLPYDDCNADALLTALHQHAFILRYVVGDNRYIQVINFSKHQNPHVKEQESTIPIPDLHSTDTVFDPDNPEQAGLIPDSLLLIPDSLHQSKKNGQARATRLSTDWKLPEEFKSWAIAAYPDLDPEHVVRMSLEFRDYWAAVPGANGRKLDWLATWRNRVRQKMGDT